MAELPEVVDDLTFVYAIKPNVHWQDKAPLNGRQFVAEDAAFGLERFGQDNPEFIWRDRYTTVDQFEAVNDLTLHLTAKEPFAPLLTAVGEIQALMVSRDAVEAFGDDGIAGNPEAAIGTGGMQHVSREADVQTELERNPNYFREGLPYFDGLRAELECRPGVSGRAVRRRRGRLPLYSVAGLPGGERGRAGPSRRGEHRRSAHERDLELGDGTLPHQGRALHRPARAPRPASRHRPGTTPRDGPRLDWRSAGRSATRSAHTRGPSTSSAASRLPLRRAARGGSGRGPAAARRQRLRPGQRAADDRRCRAYGTPYARGDAAELRRNRLRGRSLEEHSRLGEQPQASVRGSSPSTYQGLGGAFDPDILYGLSHQRPTGGRNFGEFSDPEIDALLEQGRTTLGTENRRADLRRDPDQAARRAQSPDLLQLGAGRSSDTVPGSRATARPTAAPPPPSGCTGRGSRASPASSGVDRARSPRSPKGERGSDLPSGRWRGGT